MKQLICELCGKADFVKQDGFFVCRSCGCKYSVEEAKKMMVELEDASDHTSTIDNYLEMAKSARYAGNNQEAEAYCNKVLEFDPSNYTAWIVKGEAAIWQSSIQNSRIEEGIQIFSKGLRNAPIDQQEALLVGIKDQCKAAILAMVSLRSDYFAKYPDIDDYLDYFSFQLLCFSPSSPRVLRC